MPGHDMAADNTDVTVSSIDLGAPLGAVNRVIFGCLASLALAEALLIDSVTESDELGLIMRIFGCVVLVIIEVKSVR